MNCSEQLKTSAILQLITCARAKLFQAGIEEAQEESERILMKLLGCPRSKIYLEEHESAIPGIREQFLTILEKRTKRIPLAYLFKEADFWQETLYVDERCLIPRPETEILVEQVLKAIKRDNPSKSFKGAVPFENFSFLDIGTGSGAIAIAILRACKNAKGMLLDISGDALETAWENLKRYRLEGRAQRIQGNLFEPFSKDEKWDLIVSNPPYLSETDWNSVQEELKFEPRAALNGGKDGLDFYRQIIAGAKNHLTSGGMLALETGQGQAETVSTWLQNAGYDNIHRFKDYLGVERVIITNCS